MAMTELEKRASRMKWDPPAPGTEERKEMPASAFLSPSTRTYPYKVKIDGEWVISEKGLRSAISVANFRGNSMISSRASKLLEALLSNEETEHSGDVDEFLTHFGIPGMKWGVRKSDRERRQTAFKNLSKEDQKKIGYDKLMRGQTTVNRILDGIATGQSYNEAVKTMTRTQAVRDLIDDSGGFPIDMLGRSKK